MEEVFHLIYINKIFLMFEFIFVIMKREKERSGAETENAYFFTFAYCLLSGD